MSDFPRKVKQLAPLGPVKLEEAVARINELSDVVNDLQKWNYNGCVFIPRYTMDPDFDTTTHQADWTDWDISSIVPTNCYAISVIIRMVDDTATSYVGVRPNGGDTQSFIAAKTPNGGTSTYTASGVIPVTYDNSAGQTIETRVHDNAGSPTAIDFVNIFIVGYFIRR